MKSLFKGNRFCAKFTLDQFIFLIGVVLKQFYLFPSGGMQIGDIFLIIGCLIFAIRFRFVMNSENTYLLVFVVFVFVINSIYYMLYGSNSFLTSSMIYFFNLIVVVGFSNMVSDRAFLIRFLYAIKFSIFIQFAIYLLGLGRWYLDTRYMGTFNDPNQYGFFVFAGCILIVVLSKLVNQNTIFWKLLCFALIIPSSSTGTLLGFAFMVILDVLFIENENKRLKIGKVLLVILVVISVLLIQKGIISLPKIITDTNMYTRLMGKFNLYSSKGGKSILEERGWDRLDMYPSRILYGAGEGFLSRFDGSNMEIHSSVFAPLFYYGIIPFMLLCAWYKKKLSSVKRIFWGAYLGLFIESNALYNLRQPFYWILFCLAGSVLMKKNIKN